MDDVLKRHRVKQVRYEGIFHFSKMNNLGAKVADGDILVFLNHDVEPLVSSWLALLGPHQPGCRKGIGGAKLDRQHSACGYCHWHQRRMWASRPGHRMGPLTWNWLDRRAMFLRLTGACLAIRR